MDKEIEDRIYSLKFTNELDCPLCNNSLMNSKRLYSKKIKDKVIDKKIVCKSCGLIYKSPRLDKESNKKFYEEIYLNYMFGNEEVEPSEYHWNLGIKRREELKLFKKIIKNAKFPPLEIGCSSGGVLSELSKINPLSEGIDIDPEGIKFAKSKGLFASQKDLFSLKRNSRDVIILSHVLEHFEDLNKFMKKISQILIEGGYLIIFVPDSYKMVEPPHLPHNYCFSEESIDYLTSLWKLKKVRDIPYINRPKEFKYDIIVMYRRDNKTKVKQSKYDSLKFFKYYISLNVYLFVRPLLVKTKLKNIVKRLFKR